MHKACHDHGHAYFCTLTPCKSMEERSLVQSRHIGATYHVSHMWCGTTPNRRLWIKKTADTVSQVSNHAQSTSQPRPCIILHTHSLQVHGRKILGPKPTHRSNIPCEPHVVWRNTKHAAMDQEDGRHCKSSLKPCTKHESASAMHTSAHAPATSPWKTDHWSKADKQEQRNMSTACGVAHQQTCGHGARRRQTL